MAITLVLGVALGLFSLIGDGLPVDRLTVILVALANAAGPWLVTAFAAGALQRHPRRGAIAGGAAMAAAVTVYYAGLIIRDVAPTDVGLVTIAWLVAGAVAGPLFGAAGGAWGEPGGRQRVVAAAVLAGGLMAEAAYRFIQLEAWDGIDVARTSMQVALVDAIAAALVPVVLLREGRVTCYLASIAIAPIGVALLALGTWAIGEIRF